MTVALCGCGKPKSHGGMCSVRWAVRRQKYGQSGNKAKPSADMTEEAIARRMFGELADDILLLRGLGHRVARFQDGFRVDRDVLSYEQVQALAAAKRKALQSRNSNKEIHRGAKQPEGCAKVVRTEPSMSGSVAASGDAVRDASTMPLDVVAAPHSEGREHVGSATTAPPACSLDLTVRLTAIERRIDFLFVAVADALGCKADTLVQLATRLQHLKTQLRTDVPS